MRNSILLLFSSFLFCSLKCNKDKEPLPVLPAATQEGKNTVGFTIDGNVWVPYFPCAWGNDPCGEISGRYSLPSAALDAIDFQFARKRDNSLSALSITSSGIGTITTVGDKTDSILVDFQDENWTGNSGIYGGPVAGSKFIITKIDRSNQIIAGNFELILREQNGSGRTIMLKEGRFDFSFNACKCSD